MKFHLCSWNIRDLVLLKQFCLLRGFSSLAFILFYFSNYLLFVIYSASWECWPTCGVLLSCAIVDVPVGIDGHIVIFTNSRIIITDMCCWIIEFLELSNWQILFNVWVAARSLARVQYAREGNTMMRKNIIAKHWKIS